jgi:hypothetical protein
MEVYKAISAVQEELAQIGIGKNSKNQQQGFMFRGIDAVYNALSPLLAKHKLCILPRCISRESVERATKNGGVLFYVAVQAEFDFVSAIDGTKHTVSMFGEAMDSGDKATNKAMSIAYKYAAFQAFCIPTEETASDPDAEVHQVAPKSAKAAQKALDGPEPDAEILAQFNAAHTVADLTKAMNGLPNDQKRLYTGHFSARMNELKKAA